MTRRTPKHLGRAVLAWAALTAFQSLSQAAEPQTPPVVSELVAAINAKDAKRLESVFASDFVLPKRDASCNAQDSDRACQVSLFQRRLMARNGRVELGEVKSEREITRFIVLMSSDAIRAAGVSRIAATNEIVIANGKIQSLITTMHTDDPETARYVNRPRS